MHISQGSWRRWPWLKWAKVFTRKEHLRCLASLSDEPARYLQLLSTSALQSILYSKIKEPYCICLMDLPPSSYNFSHLTVFHSPCSIHTRGASDYTLGAQRYRNKVHTKIRERWAALPFIICKKNVDVFSKGAQRYNTQGRKAVCSFTCKGGTYMCFQLGFYSMWCKDIILWCTQGVLYCVVGGRWPGRKSGPAAKPSHPCLPVFSAQPYCIF